MNEPEPSWDLYRSFRAVAQEGSLSGAARALGLTQPTVARHVDSLEAMLGRRLFVRSQRGLEPTEVARQMLPYADALAATSAALRRAVAAEDGAVSGTVRITASEVVGVERLPPILAAIRRRHPALALELATSNAVEDLLRRDADIAVRMVAPAQEALVARRVGSVEIGLFARADYLERRGTPADVAAIAEHDLIGFDRETPALRAFIAAYPWLGRAPWRAARRQRPRPARGDPGRLRDRGLPGRHRRARPRPGPAAGGGLRAGAAGLGGDARGSARQPALPRGVRHAGRRSGGAVSLKHCLFRGQLPAFAASIDKAA